MLPLINLSQSDIDIIVSQIPGGVSNIQDVYSLAPLQQGILFHHLMTKKGDPYLSSLYVDFRDLCSFDSYVAALQKITKRHDILRTSFFWAGLSEAAQVVWRNVPSVLCEVSLDLSGGTTLEQLKAQFDPQFYRMDITQAPLFRLIIAKEESVGKLGLQLMHHLIIDHFTLERLQEELFLIISRDEKSLRTPLPFRNLVAISLNDANVDNHTHFFKNMLSDVNEPTLPFGLSNVHLDVRLIKEETCLVPKILNDTLRKLARSLQVSLATLCHLAFAQVLASASGREDVIFGTVLFGHTQDGGRDDRALGLWINTLPLRLIIGMTSAEEAVRITHSKLSSLLVHEYASLSEVQRCSNIPISVPLFSALLNYRHNIKISNNSIPGVRAIGGGERTTYPLALSVEDNGDSLGITAQVVKPISAKRVCNYMQQALFSLADALEHNCCRPVRTLCIVPRSEHKLLLETWNQFTIANQRSDDCIHRIFEAQVTQNGEATAIEFENEKISYKELNSRANKLAHYLIQLNVMPESRVALCVNRGVNLVVALLAILKAGGAYIPLDPVYPGQRLKYILNDAAPVLLLTDTTSNLAIGTHHVPTINLDHDLSQNLAIDDPTMVNPSLTASNLAYVIYTSGSTGIPKGVMVEHQQLTRLFEISKEKYSLNRSDKWCLFHSISFDISVWEIWGAFCFGSQVSIVPYNTARDAHSFYKWVCSSNITVLTQTPTAFKLFMQARNECSEREKLRCIIFGGEALDLHSLKKWYENGSKRSTVLYNLYGPTETTLFATDYKIIPGVKNNLIGRPLSDVKIYLLDSHGEPVPLGAEGEIYIGGAGVARGYINHPELTAKYFINDPFSKNSKARMYRTGDKACYQPDGNLIYLGRVDHQLKIRGFRIEPAEIEAKLLEHSYVKEAVVLAIGHSLDKHLVAYVVSDSDENLPQTLRNFLIDILPDYMVPAAFVNIPAIPLTPNGKLDREALPAPKEHNFAHQSFEAPQGETEETLATVWSSLLGISQISRHDNFFALGGHSLLVVKMLSFLRQSHFNTSVQAVFDTATLAALAETIEHYHEVHIPPNLIESSSTTITPDMLPLISLSQNDIDVIISQIPGGVSNIQDIYSLAPLQHGILFHHLMAKIGDPYLSGVYLHFSDCVILDKYVKGLQKVIQRHDVLRTSFVWEGLSKPAQVVWRIAPSVLIEITQSFTKETALDELKARFDPRRYRMDITFAPLLRLIVAQESNGGRSSIQLMHHLISDHFTLEKIHEEMHVIMTEKEVELTTPIPFRNMIALAQNDNNAEEHVKFFDEMLADIDEPTLPFSLDEVLLDGLEVSEAVIQLPETLNEALRTQAKLLRVTLASLCHLAFARFLASCSGRRSVVFGTVLFGRLQAGEKNDRALGLWINTLPLRLDIDSTPVNKAVHMTHSALSGLLSHEHALLSTAQRCSNVPTSLPLFSALLNYRHNRPTTGSSLPGVTILEGGERTNYPLTLSVEDNNDSLGLTVQVVQPLSADRVCGYIHEALFSLANALENEPSLPVCSLPVVPMSERKLFMETLNTATTTFKVSKYCVHEIFETQVVQCNNSPAIQFEGNVLSYEELNTKSNELAHYLIRQGVKPETRIALCMSRGTSLIVALLGILKAGGAYVPLDPVYSGQRLKHILNDASPMLLLTDAAGRKALGTHEVRAIDLDELPAVLPTYNPPTNKTQVKSINIAYIIYTSGSTGIPKGVMVEHRHITRLFDVTQGVLGFRQDDKWCLFHSFSFDVSVWEIWGALLYGGQLAIVPHNTCRAAHDFYDFICQSKITVLNQTPSALKALIHAKRASLCTDHLRSVILAGEASDASVISQWYETYANSSTKLFNMYGTTETTVHASCHEIKALSEHNVIGRPLADLKIYLLETECEPVPMGAEGEIYISGAGVSRGYLNRPDLTTKHFLNDPFRLNAEIQMYRTGDKGRYDHNGNLIYLGRFDDQIKIRGFRIEPGEIEAKLMEHSVVEGAVVRVKGSGSKKSLVAYVVSRNDESLAHTLRSYLIELLPDYMIPSAFVNIPDFPLTANGKLDCKALPDPDDQSFPREMYEVPKGEIEEKIASLWEALLRIKNISRYDNFFELGGNSVLGVEFITCAKLLGIRIRTRELFMYPILRDLAICVADQCGSLRSNCAIPARSSGDKTPLFLLPTGIGNHSYAFSFAHTINKHFPIYVLPWPSVDETQPQSLEEMAERMIFMMRKVQPDGPYSIAGYSSGGILAYEVTKQLISERNNHSSVLFLGLIDTYPPECKTRLSATESYLDFISCRSVFLRALNDQACWNRISKLILDKAIEEVRVICSDIKSINMDFEKETAMWKQIHHYEKMCEEYTIEPLPVALKLIRASEFYTSFEYNINLENKIQEDMKIRKQLFAMPKLGWEVFHPAVTLDVIPTCGHHASMMEDPRNRSILGEKITELLLDASLS